MPNPITLSLKPLYRLQTLPIEDDSTMLAIGACPSMPVPGPSLPVKADSQRTLRLFVSSRSQPTGLGAAGAWVAAFDLELTSQECSHFGEWLAQSLNLLFAILRQRHSWKCLCRCQCILHWSRSFDAAIQHQSDLVNESAPQVSKDIDLTDCSPIAAATWMTLAEYSVRPPAFLSTWFQLPHNNTVAEYRKPLASDSKLLPARHNSSFSLPSISDLHEQPSTVGKITFCSTKLQPSSPNFTVSLTLPPLYRQHPFLLPIFSSYLATTSDPWTPVV